jgi:hypothetical protein
VVRLIKKYLLNCIKLFLNNKMNKILFTILFVFLLVAKILPQSDYQKEFITIIPGERYKAGWFHNWLFGKHWRPIWTTPLEVEVLDLNSFAGGLVPIKRGGGLQTKSLRFIGGDGRIWKFRSLDKDPSKVLPDDVKESIAEDILQDQISSANPMAPFVVEPLLEAVGVLGAEPILVYLPDDESLGEFREDFANLLGIMEIHPTENENDELSFEGALDVKGTYKLLNYLEEKRGQEINSTAFLKARLMDVLLGDWDRHMDQWRWAKFEFDNGKEWHPIPRDRDQAFAKYDGIFPSIAAYLTPQLNHFGDDYPQIEDLTWNGRFIDRRVLTELDKSVWDSITIFIQSMITDEVIDEALLNLPDEAYDLSADELRMKLRSRRDKLNEAADEYYIVVNKFADIFCSAKDDYIDVNRIDDKSTEVTVYRRSKDGKSYRADPLFHKVFNNEICIDLRIHMDGGDDYAYVHGECDYGPVVRIIGGKGKDEIVDESIVNGYFLSITPFSAIQRRTYFYDSGKKSEVTEGQGTVVESNPWPEPQTDGEKYEPRQIDRGHNFLPIPILGLDTDNGFTIGGGVELFKYNFRQVPFEYSQSLTASYYTRFSNIAVAYQGDFYALEKDSRLNLVIGYTEQFVTRYFGYGNETTFDNDLERNDFYRVDQRLATLYPTLHYNFTDKITGSVGLSFIQTKTALKNDTLLTGFRYGDYGLGTLNPLGMHLGIKFDLRDSQVYPSSGFFAELTGSYFPAVFNIEESFSYSGIDLRGYLTPGFMNWATLAVRAGGNGVWGKYPFFAGATLGGPQNVRGYNDKRFTGDAAVFGQAEVRMKVARMKLIFKSQVGINVFAETGRVFTEGGDSKLWHPTFGGGIWLSYLQSTFIISTYVAVSPERTTFAFLLGIGF